MHIYLIGKGFDKIGANIKRAKQGKHREFSVRDELLAISSFRTSTRSIEQLFNSQEFENNQI